MKYAFRKIGGNILSLLWKLAVLLIVLEGVYRLWMGAPLFSLPDFRTGTGDLFSRTMGTVIYDPVLGWSLAPNNSIDMAIPHSSDRFIMNTIDYGIRKSSPAGQPLRTGGILTVGDSFTLGTDVADADTWPAQLEAIIHQPVLNASIGGYGTDQIVMRAEALLPIVRPKILLVGILDQAILRAAYSSFGAPKPYYKVENGKLQLYNSPVPTIEEASRTRLSFIKDLAGHSLVIDRLMRAYGPSNWPGATQVFTKTGVDEVEVTCLLLKRLKQKTDELGVRTLLVMQYGGGHIVTAPGPSAFAIQVEECAAKMGYQIVDEFESLKAVASRSLDELKTFYYEKQKSWGHMSRTGNGHIARLVAAALAEPPPSGRADGFELAAVSPGDGRNLIANPEALDTAVAASSVATLKKLEATAPGPQPYQVAATGPSGEHYVAIPAGELPAGPYVLSLDVRPEGTANVRVQILDRDSNGVVGDFDLVTNSAGTTRAGTAQSLRAGIKDSGDGWRRVWLSATIPGKNALVLLGLKDAEGRPGFKPNGESYQVRAVQLEHGQSPSSYRLNGKE